MNDMKDAVIAGNEVLLNEQAALLRECRAALDELFIKKPGIEALRCGSTTLGNLRAELYRSRPSAIMHGFTYLDISGDIYMILPFVMATGHKGHQIIRINNLAQAYKVMGY